MKERGGWQSHLCSTESENCPEPIEPNFFFYSHPMVMRVSRPSPAGTSTSVRAVSQRSRSRSCPGATSSLSRAMAIPAAGRRSARMVPANGQVLEILGLPGESARAVSVLSLDRRRIGVRRGSLRRRPLRRWAHHTPRLPTTSTWARIARRMRH